MELTADKLHECCKDVMVLLQAVQLRVIAVSVNNAVTNRKFYIDKLWGGTLLTHHRLGHLTANLSTLRSCPQHKEHLQQLAGLKSGPLSPMKRNLPDGCFPNFSHITELYEMESTHDAAEESTQLVSGCSES